MRKEIMQALQQEYEQQRLKNSQEELRRRQEVITRCPEIGQYLAERQNLIFGGVRGILNGKAAADDLPARMDVMNKRIADLLRQSGFPADYLDPVYRCKQCRDTGYVGEPIREMCPCLRSAFYARLYREVGLGEKAEQSFAAFDPNVFSDHVQFSLTTVALRALPVVILGGLTSVPGAIIGGLIIGVGEKLSEVYLGPFVGGGIEIWFAYVLALVFLLFRPQGLFGEKIIDRV